MTQKSWTLQDVKNSELFQTLINNGLKSYPYLDNPIIGVSIRGKMIYYRLVDYLLYLNYLLSEDYQDHLKSIEPTISPLLYDEYAQYDKYQEYLQSIKPTIPPLRYDQYEQYDQYENYRQSDKFEKYRQYSKYLMGDEYAQYAQISKNNALFFYIMMDQELARFITDNIDMNEIKKIDNELPNYLKNYAFKITNHLKVITTNESEILTTPNQWYGIRFYLSKKILPQWYF